MTYATPAQRIANLESDAYQTAHQLADLNTNVAALHEKVDQHGIALSATMQDLRDFRHQVTARLDQVSVRLDQQSAILTAIAAQLGVTIPASVEPADDPR